MVHRTRLHLTLVLIAALGVILAPSASAMSIAAPDFDTKFGGSGTLRLPKFGSSGALVRTCEVTGGHLRFAGVFGPYNADVPEKWQRGQRFATTAVRISSKQKTRRGVARVVWRSQPVPAGEVLSGSDFDSRGRLAFATRNEDAVAKRELVHVFRRSSAGKAITGFGTRGRATVQIPGFTQKRYAAKSASYDFRVIALDNGGVLLLVQTVDKQVAIRLDAAGRPDQSWGTGGRVELPIPAQNWQVWSLKSFDAASVTPDGGLLLASSPAPDAPLQAGIGLLRLAADGTPLSSWGSDGFWAAPASLQDSLTYPGRVMKTHVTAGGDIAVLYGEGRREDDDTISEFGLRIAYVSGAAGTTKSAPTSFATYVYGGDSQDWSAEPWLLGELAGGTAFASVRSVFGGRPGSFLGGAGQFSKADASQRGWKQLGFHKFGVGAFAADPATNKLYLCGGVESRLTGGGRHKKARLTRIATRRINF